MKFHLSQDLLSLVPNAQVGLLVAKNFDNTKNGDGTYQLLSEQIDKTGLEYLKVDITTKSFYNEWTTAFKEVGLNPHEYEPSHIALLKRVQQLQGIPNINPVVNILTTVALKELVPLGGHDLKKIDGDITVGANTKKLPFTPVISKDTSSVPSHEIVYADEKEVFTRRWVWRQGMKSFVSEKTTDIFVPIDVFEKTPDEIEKIATKIASLIRNYLGTPKSAFLFGIASKENPDIELESLPKLSLGKKLSMTIHQVNKDSALIDRLLNRAVEHVYPSKETLRSWLTSGRRLNVYQGFDPTADTLHIGHTVGMRKLRDFQKLGHHVTFLIGDFTARIGDPSDKTAARKRLTKKQVETNLKNFKEQASRILDFNDTKNPVKVRYNSEWLEKITFEDLIDITSYFTVQQMIKRDMFQERLKIDKPIFLHEFLYPVMQSVDSVMMNIDVEVGGNDQTFNMLCGRDLMRNMKGKEKAVLSNKLLVDPTGKKMGKSEGNMIMLSDSPEDMYGKVMAFTDSMIIPAFEILTDIPMDEIASMENDMKTSRVNPMELKKKLAFAITAEHKGESAAKKAQNHFEQLFQKKNSALSAVAPKIEIAESTVNIVKLLATHTRIVSTNSQAKRLILQGAVYIDGKKVTDKTANVKMNKDGVLIRAGKKAVRIILK